MKPKRFQGFFLKFREPIFFLVICILAYGITIPWLGFYMDDWYLIWFKHLFGASQYPAYFSADRPLMGYFYVAANFLLGNSESTLIWQLFGVFTRWLSVVAFWHFLNTLWPDRKKQNLLASLLFAVFPGFSQQWIAVIYCFFFSCLAGFFLSLALMLKAIRNPRRFWVYSISAFVLGVYSYTASEFFYGLELIRPVVLWIEYSRSQPGIHDRIMKTLRYWLPYLVAFLGFSVWRGFFYESVNHDVRITDKILASPVSFILDALKTVYQAIYAAVFDAWVHPLDLSSYPQAGKVPLLILAAVFFVFFLMYFSYTRLVRVYPQQVSSQNDDWGKEAFWLSFISLIVAVLPFLAADLQVENQYPNDRFLLAYMLGSCLILVVLVDKQKFGIWFLTLLVAVSTGYQIRNGIRYKNSYEQQSDFFWELSWRAPDIEENTILISDDLPFSDLFSATSLTAPLNMIYAPEMDSHETPYELILTVQQGNVVPVFEPDIPVEYLFRSFEFSGNTSSMLVFRKPADGCLRILTPSDTPEEFLYRGSEYFWNNATKLSNPDRIIADPEKPVTLPEQYFGVENRNQWCYFYEKADLARQLQSWDETIQWFDDAAQAGFSPMKDAEWLPLVEAYLQQDQTQEALEISLKVDNETAPNVAGFCNLWSRFPESQEKQDAWTYLHCDSE